MPVLYGVFLYMGASSLKGIQVKSGTFLIFLFPHKMLNEEIYILHCHFRHKV